MLEAYKILIGVHLTNHVSGALGLIARDFMKADEQAKRLQRTLKEIQFLGMAGAGLAGAGFLGLSAFEYALKPAKEYSRELALMNQTSMTQQERVQAIALAWKTTGQVMTTTAAGNLEAIQELRQVFGGTPEGMRHITENLATVQKIGGILSAYGNVENAQSQAYAIAKALELKGAVATPQQFSEQANLMAKAIGASRGQVTAEDFLSAFKYGRLATQGWSNDFTYKILPTLIQEMKGKGFGGSGMTGGPGNPLQSAYAAVVGGVIPKRALEEWRTLGLLNPGAVMPGSRAGSMGGIIRAGGVRGWETFQENPFQWVKDYLLPSFEHQHLTEAQRKQAIQYLFPNRTAAFLVAQMALQPWKFQRDIPLYEGQMGIEGWNKLIKENPFMAQQAMAAQWQNVMTRLGMAVMPSLLIGMNKLADNLEWLSNVLGQNPEAAKDLAWAFVGLSGAMAISGVVLTLAAAFRTLGLALTLGGLIPALYKAASGGAAAVGVGEAAGGGAAAAVFGRFLFSLWPVLLTAIFGAGGWAAWKLQPGNAPLPGYDTAPGAPPGMPYGANVDAPPKGQQSQQQEGSSLVDRLAAAVGNITMEGQTTLNGTVVMNMGELGTMVSRMVAKGISEARSIQGSTGSRPDRMAPAYP